MAALLRIAPDHLLDGKQEIVKMEGFQEDTLRLCQFSVESLIRRQHENGWRIFPGRMQHGKISHPIP